MVDISQKHITTLGSVWLFGLDLIFYPRVYRSFNQRCPSTGGLGTGGIMERLALQGVPGSVL